MQQDNMPEDEMNGSMKRFRQQAQRDLEREEKRQQTIKRLKTDPEIQEYLSQFSESSAESFIENYAYKLETTLEHCELFEDLYEKENTKYMEQAERCLAEIQLKKLYDMRRLWGADALQVEGVECSLDFMVLAYDVMNCPQLPPITREEFERYYGFAKSPKFESSEYNHLWLGFETVIRGYSDELPEWFAYDDLYSGNKVYSDLKDVRSIKEREYIELSSKQQREATEAKYASGELTKPVYDSRPMISGHRYEDVMDFMEMFEEPDVVRKFDMMCDQGHISVSKAGDPDGEDNTDWLNEQVETIMLTLSTMGDFNLPVKADKDWRLALIKAWENYERDELIKALPGAYDHYLFRLANKIALPVYGRPDELDTAATMKNQLLNGRRIKGEPEDLDF